MEFTISKANLLEALQKIIGVVERRHSIPILANIVLECFDDKIELTATDSEIQLSAFSNAEQVIQTGSITVPGRKFFDIIKTLPDVELVKIQLQDKILIICSGRSRFTLKTLPSNEYPILEYGQSETEFQIEVSHFKHLIEKVLFSIASHDVRYYLNGLLLELAPTYIRTVSTDGHRISQSTYYHQTGQNLTQCIIPRKGVMELDKIITTEKFPLQIAMGEHFISVRGERFFYISKLIEGRFPNYHAVIPSDLSRTLELNRDTFKHALSRALIVSNEKYHGVNFHLSLDHLIIEAHNDENEEAKEIIPIEFNGEPMEVGFNATYFIDILARLTDTQFSLSFSEANQSAYIKCQYDVFEDIFVVMPMIL